jgi:hypothetical protein
VSAVFAGLQKEKCEAEQDRGDERGAGCSFVAFLALAAAPLDGITLLTARITSMMSASSIFGGSSVGQRGLSARAGNS